MPIEAREVPKILFWIFMIGLTSYVTVWAAGKIREEISSTVNN